jgi:DNA-binding SARP family transcriptional activator/TolB-like protein
MDLGSFNQVTVLSLELLGGFEARTDLGRPLELRSKKAKALLAFLALDPDRAHARDKLAAFLWPSNTDEQARHNLRQTVFALRKRLPAEGEGVLAVDADSIELSSREVEVDVSKFRRSVPGATGDALEAAVQLYRGDFLDGFALNQPEFDDWMAEQRGQLREIALEAMTRLLRHRRNCGRIEGAVEIAQRLLAIDPLQEPVHRALMELYARQGRRDTALRQYEICRRTLREELEVEPEKTTNELYWAILRSRTVPTAKEDLQETGQDTGDDAPSESVPGAVEDENDAGIGAALDDAVPAESSIVQAVASPTAGRRRHAIALVVGTTIAVLALAGGLHWLATAPSPPTAETALADDPTLALPTGPKIVVLPFVNIGGDPEQEYFADGLTEQLIADLALYRDLFVIARSTSFRFKGRSADVTEIARDLGVAYVLEGSVRRSPYTIRVTSRLVDGATGSRLWTGTHEHILTADSVFGIQDAITDQVVATLASHTGLLSRTDRWHARHSATSNLSSYECVLRALHFADAFSQETHDAARACLEQTVTLDPEYGDAWAWLAYVYIFGDAAEFSADANGLERGFEAARHAVTLDPLSQLARATLAEAHYFRKEFDEYLKQAETAIALNPNNASVIAELAELMTLAVDRDRGVALMRKAVALNPLHPSWYWFPISKYYLLRGETDKALEAAKKINMPEYWPYHLVMAYMYAHAGRQAEAEASVAEILRLRPDATVATALDHCRRWNAPPDLIALMLEGVRVAGLPEDSARN